MKTLFVAVLIVLFASALSYAQGRTKVSRIEQVDFANFTFSLSEDCMQKTVSLRNGEFKDKEVRVQLRSKILYADLTGDKINQAIVPLICNTTYGNFFMTEIFLYTLRNGEPFLLAKGSSGSI